MAHSQAPVSLSFKRYPFAQLTVPTLFVIGVVLVLVAGLRSGERIPDLSGYQEWYYDGTQLDEYISYPALLIAKDPAYFLLTAVSARFGLPFSGFIFFFALACIALKIRAIVTLSNAPLYSLLIYMSLYFLLDEMIAIRAGAASALFLMSIPALVERRYITYTLWILFATCFHYSAIILLPLVFLSSEGERPKLYLLVLVCSVVAAALGVTVDSIVEHLPGSSLDPRIAIYMLLHETDTVATNIFNRVSLPNLALCVVLLANFRKIANATPYASHIIRIFTMSQVLFFSLSGIPAFAFRLSQLMGVVGIIAWPLLVYLVKPSWLRLPLIGGVSLIFFFSSLRLFSSPY